MVLNQKAARKLLEQHGWTMTRGGKHVVKMTKPGERPKTAGEGIIGEEARELMRRFPRAALTELAQPASAEAWARESHFIGCKSAYPPGPHPGNAEAPRISPEFAHASYDIAGRRVVVAGYRLAAMLNGIFDPKK